MTTTKLFFSACLTTSLWKRYLRHLPLALSILFLLSRPCQGQVQEEGKVGGKSPTGVAGDFNGVVTTAGSIDPFTGNAKREVDDLTVQGSIGAYPLKWTRIHNTRGEDVSIFGRGGRWRHSYEWGLQINNSLPPPDPIYPSGNQTPPPQLIPWARVWYPDGQFVEYFNGWVAVNELTPLDRIEAVSGGYNLLLKDGGKVQFRGSDGTLPVAIVDPYGQTTTLEYEAGRLHKIKEPGGRYLKLTYTPNGDVVDHVEAFDGRNENTPIETVRYGYEPKWDANHHVSYPTLRWAYYDDTTHAEYTYRNSNVWLQSPSDSSPPLLDKCVDFRYAGPMKTIQYAYEELVHEKDWGQVTAEKNLNGLAVTTIEYLPNDPINHPGEAFRRETRADGRSRLFSYWATGLLRSYTDFDPAQHISFISRTDGLAADFPAYAETFVNARDFADPLQRTTTTYHEGKIAAVTKVVYPVTELGVPAAFVTYDYGLPSDPCYPYYLKSKTDERTKTTHYDRDPANNRVSQIRYPDGGVEQFTYNYFGQVLSHLMTSGGTEVFTYDPRGLKRTHTAPSTLSVPNPSPTTYYYYGDAGSPSEHPYRIDRLWKVIDPLGHEATYDYNQRGQITKTTYYDGFTEKGYKDDGTLLWAADEMHPNAPSERTVYVYDEYKRLLSVTTPLENLPATTVHYSYDPDPDPNIDKSYSHTTSSIYETTSATGKKVRKRYDPEYRLTDVIQAPGTEDEAITGYTYDEVGNQITVTQPDGQPGPAATGPSHSVAEYDARNRRTRLTDQLGNATDWQYDAAGNMTEEHRADGTSRTWDEYDAMNRVKHTTGFRHEPTEYKYDSAGNLWKVIDFRTATTIFDYDEMGRKQRATHPQTVLTAPSQTEEWQYDGAGNLRYYRNPAGQYKHFKYDPRNRQLHSYWNETSDSNANAVLTIGQATTTLSDAASRVRYLGTVSNVANNPVSTEITYEYDWANHKQSETQTLNEHATTVQRTVNTPADEDGNRRSLSIPNLSGIQAYSLDYNYTKRQQLQFISKHVNDTVSLPFFEYKYYKTGSLKMRQNVLQGNDATIFRYDQANRVIFCVQTANVNDDHKVFSHSDYHYFPLTNNLKAISRWEDDYKGEQFHYDEAYQLDEVSYRTEVDRREPDPIGDVLDLGGMAARVISPVTPVEKDWEHEAIAALAADPVREPLAPTGDMTLDAGIPYTITYDNDAINRNGMTDDSSGTVVSTSYSLNFLNQITSVTGHQLSYDANFNLSGYNDWIFVYDADNRLVLVTTTLGATEQLRAEFVYDGLGRCVKRTIDNKATVFTYDDWKPVVEWDDVGNFVAWNLYGPGADEILVRYQFDNEQHTYLYVHYHLDAMGNVQFLLGENNYGLEKYTYDAFGHPTIKGWNGDPRGKSLYGNRFMFTGREYIYTLGMYDYRHRLYHPKLGRFMQVDPIGFKGDPQNLYRYCGANPIFHSDPTGLLLSDYADQLLKEKLTADHEDVELAKPVVVQDTYRKVLGSNIPIHIRVSNSGNWNDRTIANHATTGLEARTGKGGLTKPSGSSSVSGSNVDIDMHVDWYYDAKYAGTNVVTRELQHVQDARSLSRGYGDGSRSASLGDLRQFGNIVKGFNIMQKLNYDQRGGAHDLNAYPAMPTNVPECDETH